MDLKPPHSATDAQVGKDARQEMARTMRINQLKEQVAQSAYVVDANVVAEALLRHNDVRRSLAGVLGLSPLGARIQPAGAPLKHLGT
jgi:hypothetical protein